MHHSMFLKDVHMHTHLLGRGGRGPFRLKRVYNESFARSLRFKWSFSPPVRSSSRASAIAWANLCPLRAPPTCTPVATLPAVSPRASSCSTDSSDRPRAVTPANLCALPPPARASSLSSCSAGNLASDDGARRRKSGDAIAPDKPMTSLARSALWDVPQHLNVSESLASRATRNAQCIRTH